MARQLEKKLTLVSVLGVLAGLNRLEGDLEVAEPLYEESLSLARELGELRSVTNGLLNLACVSIARGSRERPQRMLLGKL